MVKAPRLMEREGSEVGKDPIIQGRKGYGRYGETGREVNRGSLPEKGTAVARRITKHKLFQVGPNQPPETVPSTSPVTAYRLAILQLD